MRNEETFEIQFIYMFVKFIFHLNQIYVLNLNRFMIIILLEMQRKIQKAQKKIK
jgi:hypothetical protein